MTTRVPKPQEFPMEPNLLKLIETAKMSNVQKECIREAIENYRNSRAELELNFFIELFKCFDNQQTKG